MMQLDEGTNDQHKSEPYAMSGSILPQALKAPSIERAEVVPP